MLSLPKQESAQDTITRERGLAKLNQLFLQLSEPPEPKLHHITASAIGWGIKTCESCSISFIVSHTCTYDVLSLEIMVVSGAPCRQQLWKKLLDTMAGEAMWLRSLLGLPENETWIAKKDEFVISDTGEAHKLHSDRLVKLLISCCWLLFLFHSFGWSDKQRWEEWAQGRNSC